MTIIKLQVRKMEEVTVDVTFPIYRMHDHMPDYGDWIVYTRIDSDMMETNIVKKTSHMREEDIAYDIERKKAWFGGVNGLDYVLGRGEFACTAEDFNKVMQDAADFIINTIEDH